MAQVTGSCSSPAPFGVAEAAGLYGGQQEQIAGRDAERPCARAKPTTSELPSAENSQKAGFGRSAPRSTPSGRRLDARNGDSSGWFPAPMAH